MSCRHTCKQQEQNWLLHHSRQCYALCSEERQEHQHTASSRSVGDGRYESAQILESVTDFLATEVRLAVLGTPEAVKYSGGPKG